MLPQILLKKIKQAQPQTNADPADPFCIRSGTKNRSKALYCSCPVYESQTGTLNREGFQNSEETIYRGIDAKLVVENNRLSLNGRAKLRFTFDRLEKTEGVTSFFGERYEDVLSCEQGVIFPTINGFAIEGNHGLTLRFITDRFINLCNMGDYCLLFDEKDNYIFSLHGYLQNDVSRPVFQTESDGYRHHVLLQVSNRKKAILSVNAYLNKFLFDTALDAYDADRNNVYAEAVYLGGEESRQQWLILRPDCKALQKWYGRKVKRATIAFRNLAHGKGTLQYGSLRFLWCAFTATWTTREEPEEWASVECRGEKYVTLDITDYMRNVFRYRCTVSPGIAIRAVSERGIVLPTADNYMFPIVTEIQFE